MIIDKNKRVQITLHRQVEGVHVNSIVNEGIRAILNLLFLREDFTHTKSTKRIQVNKNKKDSIFMCIKNI